MGGGYDAPCLPPPSGVGRLSLARVRPLRCLVVGQLPAPDLDLIRCLVPEDRVELVLAESPAVLADLGQFDVIWRLFPGTVNGVFQDLFPAALDSHPEVRWVHTASAGIDQLASYFRNRGQVTLTHSAGVTAIPISEFVVTCLLHHCKRFPELAALQSRRQFEQLSLGELGDLKVVLFGLGAIATEVARRLSPFGCSITGVRRDSGKAGPPGVSKVFAARDLVRACSAADALVLVAPLTAQTAGVVNRTVLSELADGSVLVNVARGGLIDEADLIEEMGKGRPEAAYLDAFLEEPLPASSALWTTPGVHISPHLSWSSPHLAHRTSEFFAQQLCRWLDGEALANCADPEAGY